MANDEQVELLRQGYETWNQWRKAHSDEEIDLSGADLRGMPLVQVNLARANLRGANLSGVSLVGADLRGANLGQYYFTLTNLQKADLRSAKFDGDTDLSAIVIDEETSLGDIQWNGVDLTVVDWEPVRQLGDEHNQKVFPEVAVRAYRQVAAQLRAQGMHEYADRFAYRARVCRRKTLLKRRKFGAAIWSSCLDVLAGYGYYPKRCFVVYLVVNLCFAAIYFSIDTLSHRAVSPLSAFVLSITSFHGRGFFPSNIPPDDPIVTVAAVQAFVGLVVEASLIATFTDRYFGDR
ncbi:MAG TPA: pentapeptide repeat-containing protein [Ktedonobacterales bacterium]|nr:pentapeptide repeat-containing protein [Ktedonobacterales bacterium]